MNILTAKQIKEWDAFTIRHESIASIDLMERASVKAAEYILDSNYSFERFSIFCGQGNNGGDGLAIARMLCVAGKKVQVFVLKNSKASNDFLSNLNLLKQLPVTIADIESEEDFPVLESDGCIVDGLFGTGLNRPLEGLAKPLVNFINNHNQFVISIDMPSGLYADNATAGDAIIKADITLSFQCAKLAFMMPENAVYTGDWKVLDIGLHASYKPICSMQWVLPGNHLLRVKKYGKHDYKGKLGHAIISTGSNGKMGAAIMSAKACLRSGNGLLTMAVPGDCFDIIHTALPEAMCREQHAFIDAKEAKINAVGIGPGWSLSNTQMPLLEQIVTTVETSLLIDASGLYHLSKNIDLLNQRPAKCDTVITPHIGEFERLFGKTSNGFERLRLAIEKAKQYNVVIVLKGAFTQIITPDGFVYFNSTGNPGMAKGGSGDVLSGIITSLLAQGYATVQACVLGVYSHGLAGDIAAEKLGEHGMLPTDLIECLPEAWKRLGGK